MILGDNIFQGQGLVKRSQRRSCRLDEAGTEAFFVSP